MLAEWQSHLTGMQKHFYELNHFTVKQLMILRKEVNKDWRKMTENDAPSDQPDERIFPILSAAFRLHISSEMLDDAIREATKRKLAHGEEQVHLDANAKHLDEKYKDRLVQLSIVAKDFQSVYNEWQHLPPTDTNKPITSASQLALVLYELWVDNSSMYDRKVATI